MVKKNYTSWLIMLLISAVLLSLMACGSKKGPKNAEEASAMHKDLMAQENAILSKNTQLWDKVFMAADKGMAMIEDGKNYGDFLLKTIESAKEQFTADELKLLKAFFSQSPGIFPLTSSVRFQSLGFFPPQP